MQISVEADIRGATRGLLLMQKDINTAAVAALNRVAVTTRAVASRSISQQTSLPVNEVRQRVPLVRANKYTLEAEISAKKYAPNLMRYAARQTRPGVSAKAWRERKVYRGTFIANKGRTVFKRTTRERLPIEPVYGPSVPRTFIRDETTRAMRSTIDRRFPLEFDRALGALLRRR